MVRIWHDMVLQSPWWLLLLCVIPIGIWWRRRAMLRKPAEGIPYPGFWLNAPSTIRSRSFRWMMPLFWIAVTLGIIALSRPQREHREEVVKGEGIDIFLVMDLSSSMLARDFQPDRLSVSKRVAEDFVRHRTYDRIGLAVFAGESYTQCPLTHDHNVLIEYLQQLACGELEDGTAIGMGLAAAVNRLKDSDATSKVVVLLTDGVNNAGYIRPLTASGIAKEFNIKVYTIGVGSYGQALSPVRRRTTGEYLFGLTNVEIDEALLKEIASQTGGKYYRAVSEESLQQVYNEIDQLEKTQVEISVYKRYSEMYYVPLLTSLLILGLMTILRFTWWRTLPY